ncbi:MAG: TrmB family transcriptional regulator [Thermoplasmata archaeon]
MSEVRVRANVLLEEAARTARDEVIGILRDIGLTGYAASAFFALARVPEATAGELVLRTGIPDSKIYYALKELVEMGLAEVQAGKPKAYRVVPPRDVEDRLQRILEAKYERGRAAVGRLASLLEPLRSAAVSPTTDIAYVVKGLANVMARAQAMMASARREILLLVSQEDIFRKLEADLAEAARRGVRVKLAVPDVGVERGLERVAEVRSIVCSCLILVVDGQQILTVNHTSEDSTYGITSTDETLVRLGLDYWDSPKCCVEFG